MEACAVEIGGSRTGLPHASITRNWSIGIGRTATPKLIEDPLHKNSNRNYALWKPDTAAQVRERVAELMDLADDDVLDLMHVSLERHQYDLVSRSMCNATMHSITEFATDSGKPGAWGSAADYSKQESGKRDLNHFAQLLIGSLDGICPLQRRTCF